MTIVAEPNAAPLRAPNPWLRPGVTCCRQDIAPRVALLHDGSGYFGAARRALLAARRSILLIGWSFDPRMCLRPDQPGAAGDESIADLLRRLKAERPDLEIRLLIWDMPWPISAQSDMKPEAIRAILGANIAFALDSTLPLGACHHQKVLVIDDRIGFCGGSDFEANRRDTPAHGDRDARRRLPSGEAYPPRHDVMMLVDGAAAQALGEIARQRWFDATGERLNAAPARGEADPWPAGIAPDFEDVAVALTRTIPAAAGSAAIRESEALYRTAIREARDVIYLENQYFTSPLVAAALAERLAEPEGPDIIVVVAERSPNGFDRLTMDSARRGLIAHLRAADRFDRFRIVAPHTENGRPILVHSKVAVFDDRLLRVGSTNLNNRSFGYDTECDLAIEASLCPDEAKARATIAYVRNALLAHHAGCPRDRFGEAAARTGSLRAVLDDCSLVRPARLCPVVASPQGPVARFVEAWHLGDPFDRADAWRPWLRPRALRQARSRWTGSETEDASRSAATHPRSGPATPGLP
ncbi:phospholipase D-like domain-containing protein [Methylobacterium soli]|uniref:Phospholipase D n=1 Tax=Methylobacterium soli TaxID=553447 RepID=A0A6L3SW16_9HYPH|nr:phospholipase D-like domain-containing protein [Methylobacterium soli]KAB1076774.1 phospholipase [Methylobacterium soli]GJE45172.1 Cardiolipin synthase B [Methylobacterium soli]